MRVAVLPRHQEHLDNGQWTKGGKGGIDRQRRSTPHRAIRLDLSRPMASESADMAPYTDFSPWDKVFFRVFPTHERPTSLSTCRDSSENPVKWRKYWVPTACGTVPMASFPGKQLASRESCSPQRLSMSSHGQSLWAPSRVYKSTLMPAQKQLLPIL
jgi:hypothetical protein